MAKDAITGQSKTGMQSFQVQLPRSILLANALNDDPRGISFGSNSRNQDWLYLRVTPEMPMGDSLPINNTKEQAITYFPWDVDGNGMISTVDAIAMVNRIGPAPLMSNGMSQTYDLNGDGFIDQVETMTVVERIGLRSNPAFASQ